MKKLKIITLVLILLLPVFILSGCVGQTKPTPPNSKSEKEVEQIVDKELEKSQKALKGTKDYFDLAQISKYYSYGDEIQVEFMTRDYPPEAAKAESMEEMMAKTTTGAGKAFFKIESKANLEKLGTGLSEKKAPEGKEYLVVYLQFKGDSANKPQPTMFGQTGSDPAPSLFLVDKDGKKYYSSNYYSQAALADKRSAGYQEMYLVKMTTSDWTKSALSFLVDKNLREPVLVIEARTGEKQYSYVGVK